MGAEGRCRFSLQEYSSGVAALFSLATAGCCRVRSVATLFVDFSRYDQSFQLVSVSAPPAFGGVFRFGCKKYIVCHTLGFPFVIIFHGMCATTSDFQYDAARFLQNPTRRCAKPRQTAACILEIQVEESRTTFLQTASVPLLYSPDSAT